MSPSVSHTVTGLLFADGETVCRSRSATRCAADLLSGKTEWQDVIGELLSELRSAMVLNQHGRGSIVGQHVKTVSLTLLCCGLLVCGLAMPSVSTSLRASLLAAILRFNAVTQVVTARWSRKERCSIEIQSRLGSSPDALLILVNGRNSANRLTQPSLSALLHVCANIASLPSICHTVYMSDPTQLATFSNMLYGVCLALTLILLLSSMCAFESKIRSQTMWW